MNSWMAKNNKWYLLYQNLTDKELCERYFSKSSFKQTDAVLEILKERHPELSHTQLMYFIDDTFMQDFPSKTIF